MICAKDSESYSRWPFQEWMARAQERIERCLDRLLPSAELAPRTLHEAMRYSVLGGGKRIRPLLVYAAGELAGAPLEALDRVACAVELIHAYSLVHDDLPCMDDDTLRRGKPTCHVEYDEATALLVGDALQSLAFQVLAEDPGGRDPAVRLELVGQLARAAGSRGMAGGQAIDLSSVGKAMSVEELEFMHVHKTGALIRAAILMGARCGERLDRDATQRLDRFAKYAGLLFQVVDDILDCESNTATLGKTAGKDRERNKPTYVTVLGLTRAKELARELREEARRALISYGDDGQRLHELSRFIVDRRF
jgi:farnesyl diphosphate synthase